MSDLDSDSYDIEEQIEVVKKNKPSKKQRDKMKLKEKWIWNKNLNVLYIWPCEVNVLRLTIYNNNNKI